MWKRHEEALQSYLMAVCDEWERRGFVDTCRRSIRARLAEAGIAEPKTHLALAAEGLLPPWLGNEDLHRSHRASLLIKDPEWYRRFFPASEAEGWKGYVWPVRSPRGALRTSRRRERVSR